MTKTPMIKLFLYLFGISVIGNWLLFDYCNLVIGYYPFGY